MQSSIEKNYEDSIHKNIKFDCQDCCNQYKKKGHLPRHIINVHECNHQCYKELACLCFIHQRALFNHFL